MSGGFDMGDFSMMDLFRMEVDTQVEVLNENLLTLENNPEDAKALEALMRSAHSIKGAARIIDLDAGVKIAHVMEDCFVAAQSGTIYIDPDKIDVLLGGVDFLINVGNVTEADIQDWLVEHADEITELERSIAALMSEGGEMPDEDAQQSPVSTWVDINPDANPDAVDLEMATANESEEPVLNWTDMAFSDPVAAEDLAPEWVDLNAPDPLATQFPTPESIDLTLADIADIESESPPSNFSSFSFDFYDEPAPGEDAAESTTESTTESAIEPPVEPPIQPTEVPEVASPEAVLPPPPVEESAPPQPPPQPPKTEAKPAAQNTSIVPSRTQKPATVKKDLAKTQPTQLHAASSTEVEVKDRVVKVSADNLNRIMGLAGESLVEANWLEPFSESLLRLKKHQTELSRLLESLHETLRNNSMSSSTEKYLHDAQLKSRECQDLLVDRLNELDMFARRTANLSDSLYREVISSHMRPFEEGVSRFYRMVRDLGKSLGKQAKLDIIGKNTQVDRDILEKLDAPLTHILRNALDHGIESPQDRAAAGKPARGTIRLEAAHRSGMLSIIIADDGKGLDLDHLRQKVVKKGLVSEEMSQQLSEAELMEFIFLPGFSTAGQVTEISGRGVGLDIAQSMAHEVGGTVRAISHPGKGMTFHFQLPLTLSVIRTLIVDISGEPYAFPLTRIDHILMVPQEEISVIENRQYFTFNETNIGLVPAYQVLELPESRSKDSALPVIIISDQSNRYGLVIDEFLGERDLVVRPLDPSLGKVADMSAAAVREDGSLVLIVDVADLVRSIDTLLTTNKKVNRIDREDEIHEESIRKTILVVDDSITVREMERKLLENQGYQVDVAVNGMEGWNAIRSGHYDLVVTDVDMPRMTGIEFTALIKQHAKLKSTPVIIVSYKDREEDRIRGLDAGANYYLTKSSFHDDTLVKAVVSLIGR
jgi:two-component system, chemotaxis family, sensor histidine kinase and response regulator WspE